MIVTISIAIGILSVVLFKYAAGTLQLGKINIVSFVFYLTFLQCYLGCILVNSGFNKHYTLGYLLDTASIDTTTRFLWILMLLMPLTMLCVYRLFHFNPQTEYLKYLNKDIEEKDDSGLFVLFAVVIVVQAICLLSLIKNLGYIPLLKLLQHDSSFEYATERIRIQGVMLFGSAVFTNLIIKYSIPMVSYISFAYVLANRKIKWVILFIISTGMSIIVKTFDFAKSPLVIFFIVFILIFIYSKKDGIKNYIIVGLGGVMAIILAAMYTLEGYTGKFLDIYNGILGRTLFTQFGTLCYHFDLFPTVFPFLEGRSLTPTILKLIGIDPELHLRSAKLVMAFYGSEKVYDGTAGVMNALFMGESYANWGVAGALISIVWVSICISLIFIALVRLKKTPVSIAIFAVLTQIIGNTTQSGFVDFIYNFTILITIVGGLLLLYYRNILARAYVKVKNCKTKI